MLNYQPKRNQFNSPFVYAANIHGNQRVRAEFHRNLTVRTGKFVATRVDCELSVLVAVSIDCGAAHLDWLIKRASFRLLRRSRTMHCPRIRNGFIKQWLFISLEWVLRPCINADIYRHIWRRYTCAVSPVSIYQRQQIGTALIQCACLSRYTLHSIKRIPFGVVHVSSVVFICAFRRSCMLLADLQSRDPVS